MPNILLLLTGGTICSRANASGRNFSDQAAAAPQLIEQFQCSDSPYAQTACFHSLAPLDILSENMTLPHWDKLLDCLRQVRWSDYQGGYRPMVRIRWPIPPACWRWPSITRPCPCCWFPAIITCRTHAPMARPTSAPQ